MSGNTGTTATLVRDPTEPLSNVNARMRTLGKLDPNLLLAVIDTEYMVNGFKFLITCKMNRVVYLKKPIDGINKILLTAESESAGTVTLTSDVILATTSSSNECNMVTLIE